MNILFLGDIHKVLLCKIILSTMCYKLFVVNQIYFYTRIYFTFVGMKQEKNKAYGTLGELY